MDWLQNLLGNSFINALGWTLVHSIWQISIWALIAAAILVITHRRKARTRYRLMAIVLLGICITSTLTFKNHFIKTSRDFENSITTRKTSQPPGTYSETKQLSLGGTARTLKINIAFFQNYFDEHLPAIVTLWLLGFLFFFLRYLGSIAWLMRLKNTSEIITKQYEDVLYTYCRRMKLRRLVDIGKSIKINSPVVIGHFKPIILFPVQILTGLSGEQIESILLHELAHVKRNDYLVNLVQSFIEIVFFYHPAIWWLSATIFTEREHACDDLAIEGGVDANQLAGTLAILAGSFSGVPHYSQAFSGKQYKMKNRIHRLIFNEKMKTNLSQKVLIGLAIIAATLVFSFTVEDVHNQNNPSPESENTKRLETPAEEVETDILTISESTQTELSHSKANLSTADKNSISKEKGVDERKSAIEAVQSENLQDDSPEDDEDSAEAIRTLMKTGAKEWNKYRKNHPEENFDDALKESNLAGFDFSNFNLSHMNLKEANLTSCNFTNADMTGVDIKEATLDGSILENAILREANMKELSLRGINLKGAILENANLKEITMINCDLSHSDLGGTVMNEAEIENCNFKGATANLATLFPPGFDWAAQGIKLK